MSKPQRIKERDIPIAYVHECLRMDDDGNLYWKARPRSHFASEASYGLHKTRVGTKAGTVVTRGYLSVGLSYRGMYANLRCHRVVWLFVHGAWPANVIDHINGLPTDNRPCNLRDVTVSANSRNRKGAVEGLPGAYLRKGRFDSAVFVKRGKLCLGRYDTAEEAHATHARAQAYLRDKFGSFDGLDPKAAMALAWGAVKELT